jgi:hypothetical protein
LPDIAASVPLGQYVAHWQKELARLKGVIDKVGWEVLSASGSLKEFEKYREITFHADKLLTHLADINSQTLECIAADDFDMLKRAIDVRLHQLHPYPNMRFDAKHPR